MDELTLEEMDRDSQLDNFRELFVRKISEFVMKIFLRFVKKTSENSPKIFSHSHDMWRQTRSDLLIDQTHENQVLFVYFLIENEIKY